MHEENKNHYEIVVIGENHVNPNHAKIEAKIIKKFKPEYILYEGFVDNPKKEIKKFIDSFISNNNDLDLGKLSDEIKHNYILLRSMQDSKAEISGCDFKVLQQEQDKYEITVEDTLKGEEQVEEKRRKFFEINRIRSMYMA
nr:hypothetical protein [Nanoarchaeota archaeon]